MIFSREKKLPKYCVIVGHSKEAQGAINKRTGISEFAFNSELAEKIRSICNTRFFYDSVTTDTTPIKSLINVEIVFRDTYKELPNKINKLKPKASIDLHCNSVEGSASGTEVLIKEGNRECSEFAKKLLFNLVDVLNLRNRGVKQIGVEDRGGYLVWHTEAPCVISEPFFLNNDYDFERALDVYEDIAEAVILSFLNQEELEGVILCG